MNAWASAARAAASISRVGGVGPPVGDVGPDGVGEEEAVLEHDADLAAERVEGDVADVDPVDLRRPPAGRRRSGGGGARPSTFPTPRSRPAPRSRRAHLEVEVRRGPARSAGSRTRRRSKLIRPPSGPSSTASGFSDHVGQRVEELEDPLGAGPGLLGDHEHARHLAGRRHELGQVGEEGDQRPDRDPCRRSTSQPAERQDRDLAELGHRLERRGPPRPQTPVAHPRPVEAAEGPGDPVELAVLLAEPLHDPHPAHRVVDGADHLGHARLHLPAARGRRPAASGRRAGTCNGMSGTTTAVRSSERWSMIATASRNCRRLARTSGQLGEQRPDEDEVRVGPRDELAGLQLVVAGEVEPLEVREDGVAEVVVDVPADPPRAETPDAAEDELQRIHAAHEEEERLDLVAVVEDRARR